MRGFKRPSFFDWDMQGRGTSCRKRGWHDHFDDALAALSAEKSIRKVYITSGDDHVHAVGIMKNKANLRIMVNRLYSETFFKKISWQTMLDAIFDDD